MKSLALLLLALAWGCAGCIPIPHTSTRFPKMTGRVFDAATRQPIVGATLAIDAAPRISTTTDREGGFRIERQTNVHLAYDVMWGDIGGKYWRYDVLVTAPGYAPEKVSAPDHHQSYDKDAAAYVLKDIFLTPQVRLPK